MKTSPIEDKLGHVIEPGAYIAYGHALGRCAGIRIGRVLAAEVRMEKPWHGAKPEPVYRITVQGVEDDWNSEEPKLTERKGTLQFPERIVVVPEQLVPPKYTDLLKDVI